MPRTKLKLALISNSSSRKATFNKRKTGILKKVKEISTLCGIIYSPYNSNPEVWPSNSGVQRIISDFRALPEVDQHKKMVDQETFLRERIAKVSKLLNRARKDNREHEMTEVMFQCLGGRMRMFDMNITDLNYLDYLIDQKVKDLNRRMDILGNSGMEIGETSNAAVMASFEGVGLLANVPAPAAMMPEVGSSSSSVAAPTSFNLIQHHHYHQQFQRPAAPHVVLYEHPQNMNHNQNQQQWFMGTMNHSGQTEFPFMDVNHHHNQTQQQHIPGDSSTTLAAVNSSSLIPVTSPNLTNNI